MDEKTLVFIKPDGVKRQLVGRIISQFEDKGFLIERLSLKTLTASLVEKHYEEHIHKPFFPELKTYIMSGPVVICVLSGEKVIEHVRKMVGATNPLEADPGTLRGQFALTTSYNIIHASDSSQSAEREIGHFFPE